ncbi:proton extrusion protein PcxA [Iningainema tapete]|uniref:Proton extrusion protein PxcA n=1 Tax=Iningainema tapete BLCC-T55 TaxID=2748662 RepID=A0A8J6XSH5_9CYAN|nr:proton extrusion protein PcxA [Iningainema tapete]MBD2775762.1 proton extrusion protein PcxA [Iningainema tapete BLCC-T55]
MIGSLLTINISLFWQRMKEYWSGSNRWLSHIPDRALLEAYEAAQAIKKIENEHFEGKQIYLDTANYTENVIAYWQEQLDKYLGIIRAKLVEFKMSRSLLNNYHNDSLEKLKFIDEVIVKYTPKEEHIIGQPLITNSPTISINQNLVNKQTDVSDLEMVKVDPVLQKTGVFPRSIGRTITKIINEISPEAEQEFIRNFQISKARTRKAVRFLALLIIVPLLTQQLSKPFFIAPILEKTRGETAQIFLNSEMEEKAFKELKFFEERLKFENLIQENHSLAQEVVEEKVKQRAVEIANEFREKSTEAISNVCADLLSLLAFGFVIVTSKTEIAIVKSFIDEIVYGLSDSAKAFIIILFTDIFVGFHSPHGWEVLLSGLAEHLGLPANESAIFLFIATFPVILDTIFKYWIFRYLSRLSPSALATLKEMND